MIHQHFTINNMKFTTVDDIATARGFEFNYTVRHNANTGKYDVIASKTLNDRQKIERGFDSLEDAITWANDDNRLNCGDLLTPAIEPLSDTIRWFKTAVPEPTIDNICVQLGCDIEETSEILDALGLEDESKMLNEIATFFKQKQKWYMDLVKKLIDSDFVKINLLDGLIDRQVTGLGLGYMLKMNMIAAANEVNRSNFSKFVDGKPIFDENGKIKKGDDYSKPVLAGLI